MKMISISLVRLEGDLFAQITAGNDSGTKIVLRTSVKRFFEDNFQILIDQVFGYALASLIRDEDRYRELEEQYAQKATGLVRQVEGEDAFLANWCADALETF